MRIVELVLDEDQEFQGIEAISIVENPAIESDFVALKQSEIKLAEVSKDKRILMGALLIPNKPIYRMSDDGEYYIYFSKDTIEKASQMYLRKGNQNNSTLEHQHTLNGLTLVESWLVEDDVHDKSRKYGLNVPVGTWMGTMKVNNDQVWQEYVKKGKVKGFSIEGYFADKVNMNTHKMAKQISGQVAYDTIEEAESMAESMGCKGHHEHEIEGVTYYMPCETHEELKAPCWDGYEAIGFKMKNGKNNKFVEL